jgi:hypothetical protein
MDSLPSVSSKRKKSAMVQFGLERGEIVLGEALSL